MQPRRHLKCCDFSKPGRKTLQPMLTIKLSILQGVDQIESRHPQPHRRPQYNRHPRIKLTSHRQPRPHWSRPQCQPQKPMRPPGEPLCQGIKKDNPHRNRTQHQTQRIQNPRSTHQSQNTSHHRRIGDRFGNEGRPHGRPRILLIDRPVCQSVERHRSSPRPHQTNQHPHNHILLWHATRSQKHRRQPKGHGKYRMRNFNKLTPSQDRKLHVVHSTTFYRSRFRWKVEMDPIPSSLHPRSGRGSSYSYNNSAVGVIRTSFLRLNLNLE